MKATLNTFAPDLEAQTFNLNPTNDRDDAARLVAQVTGLGRDIKVVTVAPSFEGSFDLTVEATEVDIYWLAEELGIPAVDVLVVSR